MKLQQLQEAKQIDNTEMEIIAFGGFDYLDETPPYIDTKHKLLIIKEYTQEIWLDEYGTVGNRRTMNWADVATTSEDRFDEWLKILRPDPELEDHIEMIDTCEYVEYNYTPQQIQQIAAKAKKYP